MRGGMFLPDVNGNQCHDQEKVDPNVALMATNGINAVRVYKMQAGSAHSAFSHWYASLQNNDRRISSCLTEGLSQ